MPDRKRGRPPKQGKWVYYVKTGTQFGNLGAGIGWNKPTLVKNTDTETKRAAQKFFRAFQKPMHLATCTLEEKNALVSVIQALDELRESVADWEPSSFEHELTFRWSCAWGDQGTFTAICVITRAPYETTVKTGGML